MSQIIRFFIRYPIWSNAFILFTLVIGIISYLTFKKSFFPERPQRNVIVQVVMPGAAPEEMEEGVTQKVEEAIKGIQGIEQFTSVSSENTASITAQIDERHSVEKALTDIKNAVDGISSFPVNAEQPIVYVPKSIQRAISIILSGDVPLKTLKEYAESIEDDFLAEDGISQISLQGIPNLEIAIEVKEETLLSYQLTIEEIANAIRLANRDISGGGIKTTDEELLIRSRNKHFNPDEIGNTVVRATPNGAFVRLSDIADIKLQFADVPNKIRYNGKTAVQITVDKLIEEDIVKITDYVKDYASHFNSQEQGLEIAVSYDGSIALNQRLNLLYENGALGLLLVLIALGIFLSLRLSFWVSLGIPLSFLGMFFIALQYDVTINMISLFGMILVIGILVDDGIVIAENIYAHYERGKSAINAAIDGSVEVLPAVYVSVITTMLVFSTFFFMAGRIGDIVREMAIVIIACLGFSLLEATFVLPAHLAHSGALKKKQGQSGIRKKINAAINFARMRIYAPILGFSLNFRLFSVAIMVFFMLVIYGMSAGGFIKNTFFPPIGSDYVRIEVVMPPGTNELTTLKILERIEHKIWKADKIISTENEASSGVIISTTLNLGNGGGESGAHTGNVYVELTDGEKRALSSTEVTQKFRKAIEKVPEVEKLSIGGRAFFGKPVALRLTSSNLQELDEAKEYLKSALSSINELKDVNDNVAIGKREIQIKLKEQAYLLGFNQQQIAGQIRQAFFGEEVQRLQSGSDELRVWVRYPPEGRSEIEQLENMRVKLTDGSSILLSSLVDFNISRGIASIKHYNGKREIMIQADLENEQDAVDPIMANIKEEILPTLEARFPGVSYRFSGQAEESGKFNNSIILIGIPILFLIYIILSLAFRSWSQSIMVILLVPLGVFCAQLGHFIVGIPVSILSMYGFIALSGIIINDAVVFVNKFNSNLKEGLPVYTAAYDAGLSRFRPIVLTSITTVAGLSPLIVENSMQAQFLIPMAVSVVFGVLFGTMFILVCFPALILLVNDLRLITKNYKSIVFKGYFYGVERNAIEPAMRDKQRGVNFDHELKADS